MRKRLLLATGAMAGLVCAALLVVAMLPTGPGVTKANFDRIEMGMSLEKVEGIFGQEGKRGVEGDTRTYWKGDDGALVFHVIKGEPIASWKSNDGSVAYVWFPVGDDRIIKKRWNDSNETLPCKIRRWLHLP